MITFQFLLCRNVRKALMYIMSLDKCCFEISITNHVVYKYES